MAGDPEKGHKKMKSAVNEAHKSFAGITLLSTAVALLVQNHGSNREKSFGLLAFILVLLALLLQATAIVLRSFGLSRPVINVALTASSVCVAVGGAIMSYLH